MISDHMMASHTTTKFSIYDQRPYPSVTSASPSNQGSNREKPRRTRVREEPAPKRLRQSGPETAATANPTAAPHQSFIAQGPRACANFLSLALGLPNSKPCKFNAGCKCEHPTLPTRGNMSQGEKDGIKAKLSTLKHVEWKAKISLHLTAIRSGLKKTLFPSLF